MGTCIVCGTHTNIRKNDIFVCLPHLALNLQSYLDTEAYAHILDEEHDDELDPAS